MEFKKLLLSLPPRAEDIDDYTLYSLTKHYEKSFLPSGKTIVYGRRGIGKTFRVLLSLARLREPVLYVNFYPGKRRVLLRFAEYTRSCDIHSHYCVKKLAENVNTIVLDDLHYGLEEYLFTENKKILDDILFLLDLGRTLRSSIIVLDEAIEYYKNRIPFLEQSIEDYYYYLEDNKAFKHLGSFYPNILIGYNYNIEHGELIKIHVFETIAKYFSDHLSMRDLRKMIVILEQVKPEKREKKLLEAIFADNYLNTLGLDNQLLWRIGSGLFSLRISERGPPIVLAPNPVLMKAIIGALPDKEAVKILENAYIPYPGAHAMCERLGKVSVMTTLRSKVKIILYQNKRIRIREDYRRLIESIV